MNEIKKLRLTRGGIVYISVDEIEEFLEKIEIRMLKRFGVAGYSVVKDIKEIKKEVFGSEDD